MVITKKEFDDEIDWLDYDIAQYRISKSSLWLNYAKIHLDNLIINTEENKLNERLKGGLNEYKYK